MNIQRQEGNKATNGSAGGRKLGSGQFGKKKFKKKNDRVPRITTIINIALVTNDPKFSYMLGMALRICGYDNLSIYDHQSNWIKDISKSTAQTLVLIDTANQDIAKCTEPCEDFIRQEMRKMEPPSYEDRKESDNFHRKFTDIRFCFLVSDRSVQTTYRNKFKANQRVFASKVDFLPCVDIVERPFTVAEVAATVGSQILHLRD